MQINWCLKGIAEGDLFNDRNAANLLTASGILSNWMRANAVIATSQTNIDGQNTLNASALDRARRLLSRFVDLVARHNLHPADERVHAH